VTTPARLRRLLPSLLIAGIVTLGAPGRAHADEADPWFGQDKLLHFLASSTLTTTAYGGASLLLDSRTSRALVAAGTSLAIGGGKELIYDRSGRGDPSWRDFTWDVIGTAFGLGVALVINWASEGKGSTSAAARPLATQGQIAW
jgi:putative lipoprotein